MRLSKATCQYLNKLPAVEHVDRRRSRIYYTDEFRDECMRRYRDGDRPCDIFRDAGLGSEIIGYKRIERSIARWRKGTFTLKPAKPSARPDNILQRIDRLEERLRALEEQVGRTADGEEDEL